MEPAHQYLAGDGLLARRIPAFNPRPQQQAMADRVAAAIADAGQLVIEAGTGVGKTFAYLVPAILSGKKVIVSTGTRHLQDQLYDKDLPLVRQALAVPLKTALLKGRANYLCIHRLHNALEQTSVNSHLRTRELRIIDDWSRLTQTGDIAELAEIAEDSTVWPAVTSTVDNCLGQDCPVYNQCHVVNVRRAAQEADLVVINHHLMFADLALKREGFGDLLPSADAFILDEAHQLPETATAFFGTHLGSRRLQDLARDVTAEQVRGAPEMTGLRDLAQALVAAVNELRLQLDGQPQRGPWPAVREQPAVAQALGQLDSGLRQLVEGLEQAAERTKGLQSCERRAREAITRLEVLQGRSDNAVQWFELFRRSFLLHDTPLEIAQLLHGHMHEYPCGWIFTSATLSVAGGFQHFTSRLGLAEADCEQLDSPFDYANNALLYLPERLPEPVSADYTRAIVQAALPVITASEGRTFMLFTSYRALHEAAGLLEDALDYPLLVQGRAPRRELLKRFRAAGNAVLLGTHSFWEGVDVRGPALSCVIIDKLPFASPGDPVTQARLDHLKSEGINPFLEFQLPQAVIALKQGVGRLIRDAADTGVLMICDPRIRSKSYGRTFLRSLPDIPVTQSLEAVKAFFVDIGESYETVGD